jgi:hypothetical protein
MSLQAGDRCPRCGGGFHCGINDAEPCACSTLQLDAAMLAELRSRYAGCLCLACLRQIVAARAAPLVAASNTQRRP